MIKLIFCFAILGFASDVAHAASARVEMVRGEVNLERSDKRQELEEGTEIQTGDLLVGDAGASIKVSAKGQDLSVAGPFSLKWGSDEGGVFQVLLERGKLRMRVNVKRPAGKPEEKNALTVVKTPSAVMGVRGTDFFASYEPLLGESEVICFEHEIEFSSGSSRVGVKAGYWGGVGGRFGKKIAAPMKLPENVLAHFRGLLSME